MFYYLLCYLFRRINTPKKVFVHGDPYGEIKTHEDYINGRYYILQFHQYNYGVKWADKDERVFLTFYAFVQFQHRMMEYEIKNKIVWKTIDDEAGIIVSRNHSENKYYGLIRDTFLNILGILAE